ncbi:hypothetical protein DXG01_010957 [Tephrocybe rancida]|nr:hypothetical protein DXG01_010957 [Tephrocybe rancida]
MAEPMPSPYSDDSEGSVLREFMEDIQRQQHRPSNRGSYRSQQPHHEPAVTMPVGPQEPLQSIYSGNSGGQILRDLLDAQEQPQPEPSVQSGPPPPRSHQASQSSRVVDTGSSKRRTHRSSSHREHLADASSEELMHHLFEQKKETNTLRRALRLAVERVDAETQRVIALEQDSHQTIEQLTTLNEERVAAHQEALKTSAELRLYQFQLEHAQKQILRAQDTLKTVESERNEAEEAAARARAKARKYLQEQMVSAAKEEGRRLGFEAGLRRAQEEAEFSELGSRRAPSTRVRIVAEPEYTAPAAHIDVEALSSPVNQRTPHVRQQNLPQEPSIPPSEPQVQPPTPPESDTYAEDESQSPTETTGFHDPPPPLPLSRVVSPGPSVLHYAISIPPASELERQNSQNQYLGKSTTQPWVTAREYHQFQMAEQQPHPEQNFRSMANMDTQRGGVSFAQPSMQGHSGKGKGKESWLRRTLSRPWRKNSKSNGGASISWYQPAPSDRPQPAVHVRDFGALEPPRPSFDSASVSTRLSQMDIVSPPPQPPSSSTASGSDRSYKGAGKGRRRFREKDSSLFVINEDPLSRTATPVRGNVPRGSPSMSQVQSLLSQVNGETRSNYSDPKAVEEWRRSSVSANVSVPKEMSQDGHARPPSTTKVQTGPPRRRPAHLTVPSPLSPLNAYTPTPISHVMSNHTQNSAFLGVDARPSLNRNPTSATVVGITVEPPSRSPTEAPVSARPPQDDFLSPNQSYAPSLRSMANSLHNPVNFSPKGSTAPLNPHRSRPASVASQAPPPPAKSPMGMGASRSLPVNDRPRSFQQGSGEHPRRASVASHVTANGPVRPQADNASVRSGNRSVAAGQQQSHANPTSPSPAPGAGGSHKRTVSDSNYLMPNDGTSLPNGNGNGNRAHGLHRVASNQSMNSVRSANSQYSRFDPTTYVEPTALYNPVSVAVPNGNGERQRTHSNASTLSYISRT